MSQSGFRTQHSTETAFLCVVIDLQTAFDNVLRFHLSQTVFRFHLSQTALHVMWSYLTNSLNSIRSKQVLHLSCHVGRPLGISFYFFFLCFNILVRLFTSMVLTFTAMQIIFTYILAQTHLHTSLPIYLWTGS